MKSLEADALRAQAVIAKVEEMKRVDEAPQGSPVSYGTFSLFTEIYIC